MSTRSYTLLAALLGIACGFLTIHSFFAHSWTSILFWIVFGLLILALSPDRRTAVYAGASFGFFDIAVWLISGFQGSIHQAFGFSVMLLALSVCGGVCGMVGALLFNALFRRN